MKQKLHRLSKQERAHLLNCLTKTLRNCDAVLFAYAYGSFAEGAPFHDIDVGIYLSKTKKEDFTPYALDLARLLNSELKIPVDVRVINLAPVTFLYHVIQGILIHERNEDLRTHFVERTIQKYLDMKPLIHKAAKEAFAA